MPDIAEQGGSRIVPDFSKIKVEKLSEIFDLRKFDCGDKDINDFLWNDALKYQRANIATTLLFIYENSILGFCSLAADSVKLEKGKEDVKIRGGIGHVHDEYPALKLARFGRDIKFRKMGIGNFVLNYVVGLAVKLNESAAIRFITLDAYPKRVDYYTERGFVKNLHADYQKDGRPVSMRLDLKFVYGASSEKK
jgi:predicted GNAT family N-acyltransferase